MTILVSIHREDGSTAASRERVFSDESGNPYVAATRFRLYETGFSLRIPIDPERIGPLLPAPDAAIPVYDYLETLSLENGEWYPDDDTIGSLRADLDFAHEEHQELLFERVIGLLAGNLRESGHEPGVIEQIVRNARAIVMG